MYILKINISAVVTILWLSHLVCILQSVGEVQYYWTGVTGSELNLENNRDT